ncbi:MAG: hypothetical protein JJE29_05345 [Peptostreptococcaceae bacterium]|nr:hypothetical protein [Peptostreptococcaceae bacterium]
MILLTLLKLSDFNQPINLPGYQEEEPFEASVLVAFRKRLSPEIIAEANEYIINPKRTAESINSD